MTGKNKNNNKTISNNNFNKFNNNINNIDFNKIFKDKISNKDIKSILKIWLEENIKFHDFISADYWEKNYEIMEAHYIPNSITYCHKHGEKISGFISIVNEENKEDIGHVGALFIRSKCQNKGIGSFLINNVKEDYFTLSLAAYTKNKKAISFYSKHGFKIRNKTLNQDTNEYEYLMKWKK